MAKTTKTVTAKVKTNTGGTKPNVPARTKAGIQYTTGQAEDRLTGIVAPGPLAKTQRLRNLVARDIAISKHKANYYPGAQMTLGTLLNDFGITHVSDVTVNAKDFATYKRIHAEMLKMIGVQREINDVLNHMGLHMRSSGYGADYYICKKEEAKRVTKNRDVNTEVNETRVQILERGIVDQANNPKYGKVRRVFTPTGKLRKPMDVRRKPDTIGRAKRTIQRLQPF